MAKLSQALLNKASNCKSIAELQALAKAEGITLSDEDAQKFLADANSVLDDDALDKIAGGAGDGYGTMRPESPRRPRMVAYVTNCG